MPTIKIKINARRVLDAISHIGYSTESAISDIVDNSVSAKASEVNIRIEANSYTGKNALEEIHIIDNGTGMDEKELENCLALGSSDKHYSKNSLSKFGMGLKSAGLSLGERISIVSKKGGINKIVLDLTNIAETYNLSKESVTDEDKKVLENFERGTYVKIDSLRKHHPSCKKLIEKLKWEMSEVYYPMLKNAELKIKITAFSEDKSFKNEEIAIEPFDPLFEDDCHEDLNPETWDGKTPCWLLKKSPIRIEGADDPMYITCTHLVHPPTFNFGDTSLTQKKAREKYRIGSDRNKFYIYRNNRLISRDYLGLLTREQSYFAFRGRIDISTDHDEQLMLDVKKSSIRFSEDLLDKISNTLKGPISTSKQAWSKRSRECKDKTNQDKTSEKREKVLEQIEEPYEQVSVNLPPKEKQERKKIVQKAYSRKQVEEIDQYQENNHRVINEPTNEQKIEYVPALNSDQIYAPYQVQDEVRINISKAHKFQQFLSNHSEDTPYEVQQAIEILFLSLAHAEISIARNFTYDDILDREKLSKLLIKILEEFRHDFSTNLSKNLSRCERTLDKDD